MWFKKLKQKRVQFLMIGVILFFTLAIFSACLCYTAEVSRFTNDYYSRENFPDVLITMQTSDGEKLLTEDPKGKEQIESIFSLKGRYITDTIYINQEKLSQSAINFWVIDDYKELMWDVKVSDGKEAVCPNEGEIWIPKIFAELNGIQVGDTLKTGNAEFIVSALNTSSVCPSAVISIYPFYINEKDYDTLSNAQEATFVSLYFKDASLSADDFVGGLSQESTLYMQFYLDRATYLIFFPMTATLTGGIGSLAALVIFVVSIVIIRFILKSNLIKEYRSIGVYKATGFTNREITAFYLKCYAFTAVISIGLGMLAGLPLGYLLGSYALIYLGGFSLTAVSPALCLLSGTVLFALVIVNVFLALKDARKISPVEALNIGITSSKAKLKRSLIQSAFSPAAMAVNNIFKRKGLSLMVMLVLTVSFFLSLSFYYVDYTIRRMENTMDVWFSIPKHDCFVTGEVTEDFLEYLDQGTTVEAYVYGQQLVSTIIRQENNEASFSNCTISSYNRFKDEYLRIPYQKGRAPENPNEIALSTKQLALSGCATGDYIRLTIGTKTQDYLIVGSYDSMSNGGMNMQILPEQLEICEVDYTKEYTAIRLKSTVDFDAFKKDAARLLPDAEIEIDPQVFKESTDSIKNMVTPITAILLGVFTLFSLLNIVNLLLMNNLDNRKQFGILKAYGFTTRYICMLSLLRIMILSVFAALVAFVLHSTLSPQLLVGILGVHTEINPVWISLILIGAVLTAILLVTLMFSLPLRKITPSVLIEE